MLRYISNLGIARMKHILFVCASNNYIVLLCKCHLLRLYWTIVIETYFLLHVYLQIYVVTKVTLNVLMFVLTLMLMFKTM